METQVVEMKPVEQAPPLQGCEVGSCEYCGWLARVVRTTDDLGREVIICICPVCAGGW
jgi:hypothetical protein